jgi:hypothetical protein
MEVPLNQFKVEFTYPYFSYFMGSKVNEKKINRDLNLNQIPYKSEQVLEEKSYVDKNGNKRTKGTEVNPRETMATLLRLQILPNDHKATLDAYLRKLKGHIEDVQDILARIPFAITHKVANAQLSRLTGLAKTIRHITAPRLTYGHVVNNFPAPLNNDQNTGVPFDEHEPIAEPWNDSPFPAKNNEASDDEQDCQYPEGLSGIV